MKVLFLHRDLAFDGGVGQCFLQFARHFDRAKLQLMIAGLEEVRPSLAQTLDDLDVPTFCLGGDAYLGPSIRLREEIRRQGIEVIAATSFRAYVVAKAASFGLRCRVVFWIHSIPLVIDGAVRRAIFRSLSRRDDLVFVSKAVQAAHAFDGHLGESRVVYNGVQDPAGVEDLEPYGRDKRAELGIPDEALVIGCVAEFVGWKNHGVLVRAFAQLAVSHPEARLLLIGDGDLRENTLTLARELGVGDRVIAPGRRWDARRLLGLMDIYAHPANGEGFGLAVAEAMLAGLPAVVGRAGALVEVVKHLESGLLVEPDDADSLSAALQRLADDPALRASLGAEARADCLERFCPALYAENLTKVLLKKRNRLKRPEPLAVAL